MNDIKVLPQDIVNKIAAGEVVERPASVVKELVENSIDAKASEIEVEVINGGMRLIKVSDNGLGMNDTNAQMAFKQHATSKISKEEDLEKIYSFGFRGEALASISSVAEAYIHTYDGTSRPIKVHTEASKIISSAGEGRKIGTTVSIRNLFKQIPARRKFLRAEQTEYKYILDIFLSLALSHPEISFSLIKNDKKAYVLNKTIFLQERILQIYPNLSDKLLSIKFDGPKLQISGYLGHPSCSRNDRSLQFTFLNQRPINNHLLKKAVKEGYGTTLMQNMQPVCFIFLKLSTDLFDVNIHPRKLDVKFFAPQDIFSSLRNATSYSLEKNIKTELAEKFSVEKPKNNPDRPFSTGKQTQKGKRASKVRSAYTQHTSTPKEGILFTKNLLSQGQSNTTTTPIINSQLTEFDGISTLQVFNTYLIIEKEEKVLIIDQHAADERIQFESQENLFNSGKVETQTILIPPNLNLTQQQTNILRKYKNELSRMGFNFIINKNKTSITEIPAILAEGNYKEAFFEILNELELTSGSGKDAFKKSINKILSSIACHSSIRAGQRLSSVEAKQIIVKLLQCKLPYSCPHGRPIIWELKKLDLEKQFKRKI